LRLIGIYNVLDNQKYNSIKKYGWDNFKKEILFDGVVSQSEINAIETEYIISLKNKGLNISPIGGGGSGVKGADHHKSKTVLQISLDFNIVREFQSGQEASEYFKTAQTCISRSCISNNPQSNGFYWRFKKDYVKEDLISLINSPRSNSKPIYQLDKKTNSIIKEWESQHSASLSLNIRQANIWRVLIGEGMSAGGFRWAYKNLFDSNEQPKFEYKKRGVSILVKDLNGTLLFCFDNIKEASEELNVDRTSITRQLKKLVTKPKKYIYEYAN